MAQRLAAFRGGVHGDAQPLVDLALADHVAHPLRAKIAIFVVGGVNAGLEDRFAHSSWVLGLATALDRTDRTDQSDRSDLLGIGSGSSFYFCFCS